MIDWIETEFNTPPKGRILVWFDDEAFSATVLADGIVNCPALELTWDMSCDPVSELFEWWAALNEPK